MTDRYDEIRQLPLGELLRNTKVAEFVGPLTVESYGKYFPEHREEARALAQQAWDTFTAQAGAEPEGMHAAVDEIFRRKDPTFWLNSEYAAARKTVRAPLDFQDVQPHIIGQRVLDLGSGFGYLSAYMAEQGYQVATADVMDYRADVAQHLPFKLMESPVDVPYPDNSFDTTLVKTVLHHIDAPNLPDVLRKLRRVSNNLVIVEDTFDLDPATPGLPELRNSQPQLAKFMKLTPAEQLQAIMLIDYHANAIGLGLRDMNFPFQFKTVKQWGEVLDRNGFSLGDVALLGFQNNKLFKTCAVVLSAARTRD